MKMTGLAEFGASLYCGDGREAHWIYWCCTEHNHLARSLCPRSTRPLQTTVAAIIRHRKENNRLPFFGSAGDSRRTRIQYIYSPIYPYSKNRKRWKENGKCWLDVHVNINQNDGHQKKKKVVRSSVCISVAQSWGVVQPTSLSLYAAPISTCTHMYTTEVTYITVSTSQQRKYTI